MRVAKLNLQTVKEQGLNIQTELESPKGKKERNQIFPFLSFSGTQAESWRLSGSASTSGPPVRRAGSAERQRPAPARSRTRPVGPDLPTGPHHHHQSGATETGRAGQGHRWPGKQRPHTGPEAPAKTCFLRSHDAPSLITEPFPTEHLQRRTRDPNTMWRRQEKPATCTAATAPDTHTAP